MGSVAPQAQAETRPGAATPEATKPGRGGDPVWRGRRSPAASGGGGRPGKPDPLCRPGPFPEPLGVAGGRASPPAPPALGLPAGLAQRGRAEAAAARSGEAQPGSARLGAAQLPAWPCPALPGSAEAARSAPLPAPLGARLPSTARGRSAAGSRGEATAAGAAAAAAAAAMLERGIQ